MFADLRSLDVCLRKKLHENRTTWGLFGQGNKAKSCNAALSDRHCLAKIRQNIGERPPYLCLSAHERKMPISSELWITGEKLWIKRFFWGKLAGDRESYR
jgi:hypothetical protein